MKFGISFKKHILLLIREKSYKNTLNVPKFLLENALKPTTNASDIYSSLYKYTELPKSDLNFVLHDGPPYANGNPHVGHALNKVLKDVIIHYKKLQGYKVEFKPGWDCHGLPIEMKSINKNLKLPIDIRINSAEIANKYIDIQKSTFKSWGVSADWNNNYATNDFLYQSKEIQAFIIMYKKGLIFREALPTFWSCSSMTALAESELEYNENHCSETLFVKFHLLTDNNLFQDFQNISLLIWTTTPWTLIANEAVGVRHDMKYLLCEMENSNEKLILGAFALEKIRQITGDNLKVILEFSGNDLKDVRYYHPLISKKICSIHLCDFVTNKKGTGLVHVAPAHGKEDFQLIKSHRNYYSTFVTADGKYTDICGEDLFNLDIFHSGTDKIINMLKSDIIHKEKLFHSYPYDWRTKKPVIIRLSTQWFIDVGKLSNRALSEYEQISVYPSTIKDAMIQFIKNRPNWCISRQRKWGVPIPVLFDENNEVIIDEEFINHLTQRIEKEGSNFWWMESMQQLVPERFLKKWQLDGSSLKKSEDIFDIWFDSGLSWYCSMPENKEIDVYMEGVDQFRGWFSSSLLTGVALKDRSPFKNIVCHGFTVDGQNRKMSKSLGNVIDSAQVVDKYGVDILRYWACFSGLKMQSCISNSMLVQFEKKYFTLRNMCRFLLGNCCNLSEITLEKLTDPNIFNCLLPQDRYILHILRGYIQKMENHYENYQYDMVMSSLEELVSKVSNFYLTIIKDRLYCDASSSNLYKSCNMTMSFILYSVLSLCFPIFPCLNLEIINALKQNDMDLNFVYKWPKYSENWVDEDVSQTMKNCILPLRNQISEIDFAGLGIVLNNKTNPMSELSIEIFIEKNNGRHLMEVFNNDSSDWQTISSICEILRCSAVKISDKNDINLEEILTNSYFVKMNDGKIILKFIKNSENQKCIRCRRYINFDINSDCCFRCRKVLELGNQSDKQLPFV